MKPVFLAIFLIFNVLHIKAQNEYQQAYWIRLYAKIRVNDKWTGNIETDVRQFTNPTRLWQSLTHTRWHYRFRQNTDIAFGLGYAAVWQGDLVVPEWRPYQEMNQYLPLGKGWQLSFRGRLEERFIHNVNKTELIEGFGFRLRPRVRIQLSYMLKEKWTFRLSDEVLVHTDDGFNQNQTWLSIERQLGKGFSADLGYLKMIVKRPTNGYINRDNLRFSLIKNFSL